MKYKYLKITDDLYPRNLIDTLGKHAPKNLYYIGNINLLKNKGVGICGSRNVSQKGVEASLQCSLELIKNNCNIVSGYAKGVDRIVHLEALKNSGNTIIVLPEGIENFKIRSELRQYWDWNRVLVISEFNPNDVWTVYRAMKRNKTIISLSNTMLVIEAREKGGSIEAGKTALRLKRPLFVISYKNKTEDNRGNDFLLSQGAETLSKSSKTLRPRIEIILSKINQEKKIKDLFNN
jgi:DNA processing protein